MLLDDSGHIVVDVCADHQSILSLAIHGLGIDVILFLVILHKPSLILEHLEILGGFHIDARVVLAGSGFEVDFRLDDTIKTHFVVTCLNACLLGVKHIVRA